jgi:hypothetical protein
MNKTKMVLGDFSATSERSIVGQLSMEKVACRSGWTNGLTRDFHTSRAG